MHVLEGNRSTGQLSCTCSQTIVATERSQKPVVLNFDTYYALPFRYIWIITSYVMSPFVFLYVFIAYIGLYSIPRIVM